jgi:hypothetical protein
MPWDEFEKLAGKDLTVMYHWFEEVGYHIDIGAVRQEYSALMPFEQWMNSHWHSATRTAR